MSQNDNLLTTLRRTCSKQTFDASSPSFNDSPETKTVVMTKKKLKAKKIARFKTLSFDFNIDN